MKQLSNLLLRQLAIPLYALLATCTLLGLATIELLWHTTQWVPASECGYICSRFRSLSDLERWLLYTILAVPVLVGGAFYCFSASFKIIFQEIIDPIREHVDDALSLSNGEQTKIVEGQVITEKIKILKDKAVSVRISHDNAINQTLMKGYRSIDSHIQSRLWLAKHLMDLSQSLRNSVGSSMKDVSGVGSNVVAMTRRSMAGPPLNAAIEAAPLIQGAEQMSGLAEESAFSVIWALENGFKIPHGRHSHWRQSIESVSKAERVKSPSHVFVYSSGFKTTMAVDHNAELCFTGLFAALEVLLERTKEGRADLMLLECDGTSANAVLKIMSETSAKWGHGPIWPLEKVAKSDTQDCEVKEALLLLQRYLGSTAPVVRSDAKGFCIQANCSISVIHNGRLPWDVQVRDVSIFSPWGNPSVPMTEYIACLRALSLRVSIFNTLKLSEQFRNRDKLPKHIVIDLLHSSVPKEALDRLMENEAVLDKAEAVCIVVSYSDFKASEKLQMLSTSCSGSVQVVTGRKDRLKRLIAGLGIVQ